MCCFDAILLAAHNPDDQTKPQNSHKLVFMLRHNVEKKGEKTFSFENGTSRIQWRAGGLCHQSIQQALAGAEIENLSIAAY